ncbi:MAG: hypothetical protein RL154_636, partial [Pseudomonadota bacterium]
NPHQVEAALFAFKSPLSKGAILADEVGLGKTIEAALVISQKWAERKRKILIIAPANLRKQWSLELAEKFYLDSLILESKSFNDEIKNNNLNPLMQDKIIICSYQFASSKAAYLKNINWDLVVIDEAHRLRNVYKPNNKIANALKNAIDHAPIIMLTATPLQNSLLELYGLTSFIDPHAFGDIKSFKTQFIKPDECEYEDLRKRLAPICHRTLRKQVLEYINYTNRIAITREFVPTDAEQKLYELVSEYLRRKKIYALPQSQRTLMTLILRKLLASSTFAIAGTLDTLGKKLKNLVSNNTQNNDIEQYLGSDYEIFDECKDEYSDDCEEQEAIFTPEEIAEINEEIKSLEEFGNLAQSIKVNSKGEALLEALRQGFEKLQELCANEKAMIFTESIRTQNYVKNLLEQNGYLGKIVLFNGTNSDKESKKIYSNWLEKNKNSDKITGSKTADLRAALVEYFRDEAVIMIATEAAADGINLQFCSLVVNYDMPWNPQRIEQRIGRCHRYGQKHDVVVVNFLNIKNEADIRVYELLDKKFQLFNGVFGASDEILGAIESGVDFEKRIIEIYQNCRSSDEIKESFNALQAELEEQIANNMTQTRQKLFENFDEEVHEKLKINLVKSREFLGKQEERLWQITKFWLAENAIFNDELKYFELKSAPFGLNIPLGNYNLSKDDTAHSYRIGHPLAANLIDKTINLSLPSVAIEFNYTNTPKKISILEQEVGSSGWLQLTKLTISALEDEDYLLFAAFDDNGEELDEDTTKRLFSLVATEQNQISIDSIANDKLNKLTGQKKSGVLSIVNERNSGFFEEEMEKLDKWAEDVKKSLEIKLKELDIEIKTKKSESKKISKLESKVAMQRDIKELEKKRNELRYNIYSKQDEIDLQKEELITGIESKLAQNVTENIVFQIRWKVV